MQVAFDMVVIGARVGLAGPRFQIVPDPVAEVVATCTVSETGRSGVRRRRLAAAADAVMGDSMGRGV